MKYLLFLIMLTSCSHKCNDSVIQDFIEWKSIKLFKIFNSNTKNVIVNYYEPQCFNDLIIANEVKTKSIFALQKLWENDSDDKDLNKFIYSLELEQESQLDRTVKYYRIDKEKKFIHLD